MSDISTQIRGLIAITLFVLTVIFACNETAVPYPPAKQGPATPGMILPASSTQNNSNNTKIASPEKNNEPEKNQQDTKEAETDSTQEQTATQTDSTQGLAPATKAPAAKIPEYRKLNMSKLGYKLSPKMSPKMSPKISPKISPKLVTNASTIESMCIAPTGLGITGSIIQDVCRSFSTVTGLMYGPTGGDINNDDIIDCADYEADTEGKTGILFSIMCDEVFLKNDKVISAGFPIDTPPGKKMLYDLNQRTRAVTFQPFDSNINSTGSWTRGDESSYPVNLRGWISKTKAVLTRTPTFADLLPTVAIVGEDVLKGTIYLLSNALESNPDFQGKLDLFPVADTSSCKENPSTTTCYTEEQINAFGTGRRNMDYFGEILWTPNSAHLYALADDRRDPTLIVIEGNYIFDAANATVLLKSIEIQAGFKVDLSQARKRYFRLIQLEDELWLSVVFLDEFGIQVPIEVPMLGDMAPTMAAGTCLNVEQGLGSTCSKLTDIEGKYGHLFKGIDAFKEVSTTELEFDIDFSAPPKTADVIKK